MNWKEEARRYLYPRREFGKKIGAFLFEWKHYYDWASVTLLVVTLSLAILYGVLLNIYEENPKVKNRIQTWYHILWGESGTHGIFYVLLKSLLILTFIMFMVHRFENLVRIHIAKLSNYI